VITLEQALAQLPDDADEIAAYLIEQKCSGFRETGESCPVANYLTGQGFERVFVETGYVKAWADGDEHFIPTPEPVASFVRRFDEDDDWPELDADLPTGDEVGA
jgi:hypothetical protein